MDSNAVKSSHGGLHDGGYSEEYDRPLPAFEIDNGATSLESLRTETKFKYVLLRVVDIHAVDNGLSHDGAHNGHEVAQVIVRGSIEAEYHCDIAEPARNFLQSRGYEVTVLGGGRICFNPAEKSILVYGHSIGYPWKNGAYLNELSSEIVRKSLGSSDIRVSFSNEGY